MAVVTSSLAQTLAGMDMAHMPAALGFYPMNREALGTSWQARRRRL